LLVDAKSEGLVRLTRWIIKQRITVLLDASMLRTWLLTLDGGDHFPDVRIVILGAGPTYREHVEAFQRHLPDHCILANLYSATELRSISLFLIDKQTHLQNRLVPVGYAPAWATIEIWDEQDNPLPVGETGEIVVITPYAAAGYWKSPELTAAKFGVDRAGRPFCRMGDLGRLDEQGCLWVLGRQDGQIKIRSNRVESAEVEVALLELPNVQEAAVLADGESDEERRLIAFVAAPPHMTGIELRKQLGTRLPDYMVPSTIFILNELPRNANGKVNRPALKAMLGVNALSSEKKPRYQK
jgi:acyl-coenzyme A synthetase/AMP-(fatty) acid ligase